MEAYELTTLFCDAVKAKNFNAETDSYANLDPYLKVATPQPVVMIEDGDSEIKTAGNGYPREYDHNITLTCMVAVGKKDAPVYKAEVAAFSKSVLETVLNTQAGDYRFKITPGRQSAGEFIVSSVKVSGITINLTVNTRWKEE